MKRNEEEEDDNFGDSGQRGNKVDAIRQYGWALHHYFPDTVPSQRLPDYLSYPTHIFTTAFERTVIARTDGKFTIYWNPAITAQNAGRTITATEAAENWAHYADSGNSGTFNSTPTGGDLGTTAAGAQGYPGLMVNVAGEVYIRSLGVQDATTTTFPKSGLASVTTAEASFNRLRLLSAYLEITYVGKEQDISGYIRAGMNTIRRGTKFVTAVAGSISENTADTYAISKISLLNNYPVYRVFKTEKTIRLFYRITDESLFNFGPYDSSIDFPYYLVLGEGLPSGSQFFVRVVRTFEGVLKPSFNELCNPMTETSGLIGAKQHEVISRMFKDLAPIVSKDEYENYRDRIFSA